MLAQTIAVALIVAVCVLYATWALLPRAARRQAALRLLRLPLPAGLTPKLRRQAAAQSGCGCDGCDRASPKRDAPTVPTVQPIRFQPRPKP